MTVELVTPLRLKHGGTLLGTVPPAVFVAALARRANALNVLFGTGLPVVAEAESVQLAADITLDTADLRRVHVTRYSARQRQRMTWPGLMGHLHWHGPALRGLWPLLRFGEQVQVGKGTALGFGRYRLAAGAGLEEETNMARTCHPAPGDLDIARELARRLGQAVDPSSFEVILYGSRARGDADAESDLDILVRLSGEDPDGAVQDAALRLACDLTLAHGVLVSVLVAARAFLDGNRDVGFLDAVERYGVRV